ncbi:MAG: hypothetical protein ACK5LJ_13985 [Paracoccus sp. (in: a-proteobacteria)]
MIRLKEAHKQRFSQQRVGLFVERQVEYILETDRFHAEHLGEAGIREVVQLGVKRGRVYQITRESPLKLYIHLMFYLGSYYDVDPLLPWARKELVSAAHGNSQPNRMNALRAEFLKYLRATSGGHGEHLRCFWKNCVNFIKNPTRLVDKNSVLDFIKSSYAPYISYSGEAILCDLIDDCERRVNDAGMRRMDSVLLFAVLRIIYGAGVANDPLVPWVKKVFEKDSGNKDDLFWKLALEFMKSVERHIDGDPRLE